MAHLNALLQPEQRCRSQRTKPRPKLQNRARKMLLQAAISGFIPKARVMSLSIFSGGVTGA